MVLVRLYSFFLLFGAFQFSILSSAHPANLIGDDDGLYYLADLPSKILGSNRLSKHFESYHIVPVEEDVPRVKRQALSLPPVQAPTEGDKSAFTKKNSSIKKPITPIKFEVVSNDSTSMSSTTATPIQNETEIPTTTTSSSGLEKLQPTTNPNEASSNRIFTNTTFRVATVKPVVVDVVRLKVSPTLNSFPGSTNETVSNATNSTKIETPNATLTPPDLYSPFPEFPPEVSNNYTRKDDTHRYYNSSYFQHGEDHWVDLDSHPKAETHELLSYAHRRAATIKLDFDFPFYGHVVRNVTMATGGFVYLGEHVHAWLAATQYVAPLMANFDSRVDNVSSVRYLSNEDQFTAEWNQLHLHNHTDLGTFSFQTSLYKNGTIVFAYKGIPVAVKSLNDTNHPVKVGLSDAYITDKTILFVKSRTIFEYHRVDLKEYNIVNGSAIVFTPLRTCLSYKTCQACTTHETQFNCVWCPRAKRCSDGTDRHRQDWITKACTFQSLDTQVSCYIATTSTENSDIFRNFSHDHDHDHEYDHEHDHDNNHGLSPGEQYHQDTQKTVYAPEKVINAVEPTSSGMSASGIMGLMFFLMILFGITGWLLYAYYYPHSPSGQLLIRFRPSQWGAFRRGEARYTAASIHM